jgi:hypothetical protein
MLFGLEPYDHVIATPQFENAIVRTSLSLQGLSAQEGVDITLGRHAFRVQKVIGLVEIIDPVRATRHGSSDCWETKFRKELPMNQRIF